jgi:hypothetical protein
LHSGEFLLVACVDGSIKPLPKSKIEAWLLEMGLVASQVEEIMQLGATTETR